MKTVYKKVSIISLLILSVGCADKQFDEMEKFAKFSSELAKKEKSLGQTWSASINKFQTGEITRGELLTAIKPYVDSDCSIKDFHEFDKLSTEPAKSMVGIYKIKYELSCEWRTYFYNFVENKEDLDPEADKALIEKTKIFNANKKEIPALSNEFKDWCIANKDKCTKLKWE